jgi:hypothetical protein
MPQTLGYALDTISKSARGEKGPMSLRDHVVSENLTPMNEDERIHLEAVEAA